MISEQSCDTKHWLLKIKLFWNQINVALVRIRYFFSKTFPNPKYFNGSVCMHIMKKLASNKEKCMSLGLLVVAGYCCVLQDEVH